jgi:hypothetical protein
MTETKKMNKGAFRTVCIKMYNMGLEDVWYNIVDQKIDDMWEKLK